MNGMRTFEETNESWLTIEVGQKDRRNPCVSAFKHMEG